MESLGSVARSKANDTQAVHGLVGRGQFAGLNSFRSMRKGSAQPDLGDWILGSRVGFIRPAAVVWMWPVL
jgi:hypothetical protein